MTRRVGRFFSKLVHVLSMARLRVRSRFWKTIINPRRRHRVEGGLREDGRYEIRVSQRRREALYEDMPFLPLYKAMWTEDLMIERAPSRLCDAASARPRASCLGRSEVPTQRDRPTQSDSMHVSLRRALRRFLCLTETEIPAH